MIYKILVVDDEPTMRRLMAMLLGRKGHHVLEAGDGETGLTMALEHQPDVILLDIMMPHVDGFETLRRLRANAQTEAIPVIFLSAKSQVEDRVEGLRLGADDYIVKPADPDELMARIDAVVGRSRREPVRRKGRVLAFMGAKGGVGVTMTVANLGIYLEQEARHTILADLHLAFGNLAELFDMPAGHRTSAELATFPPAQIDAGLVDHTLLMHPSGLRILASPPRPMTEITYTGEHLTTILEQMAYQADFVLVDLPTDPDILGAVAGELHGLILVLNNAPASLVAAQRLAQYASDLGLYQKLSALQVRRERVDRTYVSEKAMAEALNCPVLGVIPPAPELYREAEERRVPPFLSTMAEADRLMLDRIGEKLLAYDKIMDQFQKEVLMRSRNLA